MALVLAAAFAQRGPETVVRGTKRFRRSVVTSGLANPWELTWGPDGKLWVTERSGKRVTRVDPATGERSVAIAIPEVLAPGGQEGLLGMAFQPGGDFVYVAYTYADRNLPAYREFDARSPFRYLHLKIVRLSYNPATGALSNPVNIITRLPAGNDHVAGRLKLGPDQKLYLTLGDRGHNQLGNFCLPIESQRLPTQKEIDARDYSAYVGKTLRLNLDGSIPSDNPKLNGVVSHVFTYGHRNPQGIDFAPDGTLYSSEHGPKTDDEINILKGGGNYGWPNVAGLKDDKAYEYARWAEASTPCSQLKFSDLAIPPSVPRHPESAFQKPFVEPIATMFTVPSTYNFHDPACGGVDFICWPTVAPSSIEHYASRGTGIPGWERVLLVTTLKRGSLYVVPLDAKGTAVAGPISRYFQSENRYRDTAVSPDGLTIYIATDSGGVVERLTGGVAGRMQDPGAILAFTYTGEGSGAEPELPRPVTESGRPAHEAPSVAAAAGMPPQFTAAQAAAGRTAYNANCAVCHGNTLTNGTMGTPLAGPYFRKMWAGRTVRALYDRAVKTMPPAAPGSLSRAMYASIVAYILEVNGYKAGGTTLAAGGAGLERMVIR
ncbi:MAG TPA: glucose/sorbosone family PQQ-dependent dehydrogenase [Bryobacteraceae bacterium]|nr:glucose/sorbosone family PQQ-dependent dehydrogenase [Bryobacteraceae bacterium]